MILRLSECRFIDYEHLTQHSCTVPGHNLAWVVMPHQQPCRQKSQRRKLLCNCYLSFLFLIWRQKLTWHVGFLSTTCFLPPTHFLPVPPPHRDKPGSSPDFKKPKSSLSTPPLQFLVVVENLSSAPGSSGTQRTICHDKLIQHPQRAASQALSVMKLSALNAHWWQITPPPLIASFVSLIIPYILSVWRHWEPLQKTHQRAICFLHSRLCVLITGSFCLLFSFL